MSETERNCCTCKYAELKVHEEPCWTCRRSKVHGTEEYDTAPDLWESRIPSAVKKKTEPNVLQTVVRTHAMPADMLVRSEALHKKLDKLLKKGWRVVMCNPIGDDLEYILQKTEVEENG